MARLIIARTIGIIVLLCVVGEFAWAQMKHDDAMVAEGSPPLAVHDRRITLGLPPAVGESLKLTMREHLDDLHAIVAALAQEDYGKAAVRAHENLGFPKHHQAMQREAGASFPLQYHELAMAHHQAAEQLAEVISSKDLKRILPHLERTIKSCVACHEAYKL